MKPAPHREVTAPHPFFTSPPHPPAGDWLNSMLHSFRWQAHEQQFFC
ncbi:hypothetical protein GJR88_04698 [Dietzia sp. DQ12-45-1b]|nr:hypothetical protein GJR88_04698 [Dietzia sp. DQ12-45-1b]